MFDKLFLFTKLLFGGHLLYYRDFFSKKVFELSSCLIVYRQLCRSQLVQLSGYCSIQTLNLRSRGQSIVMLNLRSSGQSIVMFIPTLSFFHRFPETSFTPNLRERCGCPELWNSRSISLKEHHVCY